MEMTGDRSRQLAHGVVGTLVAIVALVLVQWFTRPTSAPESVEVCTDTASAFGTASPNLRIDADRGRVTDVENPAELRQYFVGMGGELTPPPSVDGEPFNRVTLRFRPLNQFSYSALVLRHASTSGSETPRAAEFVTSVGRRQTAGDTMELQWTAERPITAWSLHLPRGADWELEALELSRVEVASPARLYLLVASLLLPLVALASLVVRGAAHGATLLAFVGVWATAAAIVVFLASQGHNAAVESYHIQAQAVNDGQSVYAETPRYNYGVTWAYLAGATLRLHDAFRFAGTESYHVLLATLVFVGTLTIGTILSRAYTPRAGIVFACFPPLLMLTGFHTEFGNVALATALVAWLPMMSESHRRDLRWVLLSATLMGLSLSVKHFMILFPVCVLLWRGFGALRHRVIYATIAYAIFFVPFLVAALHPLAREGMIESVFLYGGGQGHAFIPKVFKYTVPMAMYEFLLRRRIVDLMWVTAVLVVGHWWCRHRDVRLLPIVYLLVFVAFSPTMADAYLTAPLIACAVWHRNAWTWLFVAAATVVLVASPHDVGTIQAVADIVRPPAVLHRFDVLQFLLYGLLFFSVLRKTKQPDLVAA